jgi:NTP pyrophosphatase (non-canonical NTP hydrolase)
MKFKRISDVGFRAEQALELQRARTKFPGTAITMIALTEEVGELAKALMDESPERIVEEAIQVAVMAQRVATEGDRSVDQFRGWRPKRPPLKRIKK